MSMFHRISRLVRGQCSSGRYIYSRSCDGLSSQIVCLANSEQRGTNLATRCTNKRQISTSVNEFPLSREEAVTFVTDTLEIPNFRDLIKQDELALLNMLLKRLKYTIPLTTVTILSQCNDQYKNNEMLFLEQCKEDMLSTRSGQCYWITSFFNALLNHLQYDTTVCGAGDKCYTGVFNIHSAVVVHNLGARGRRYLVECNPFHPVFRAVPLDFDEHSDSFTGSGKKWKYFRSGDGLIKYCNLIESGKKKTFQLTEIVEHGGKQWEVFMDYRTRRNIPLSNFTESCFLMMTTPLGNMYQKNLRIQGFSRAIGEWVTIMNEKVEIKDGNGVVLESVIVSSANELIDLWTAYFPQYPDALIETCLKNRDINRLK